MLLTGMLSSHDRRRLCISWLHTTYYYYIQAAPLVCKFISKSTSQCNLQSATATSSTFMLKLSRSASVSWFFVGGEGEIGVFIRYYLIVLPNLTPYILCCISTVLSFLFPFFGNYMFSQSLPGLFYSLNVRLKKI